MTQPRRQSGGPAAYTLPCPWPDRTAAPCRLESQRTWHARARSDRAPSAGRLIGGAVAQRGCTDTTCSLASKHTDSTGERAPDSVCRQPGRPTRQRLTFLRIRDAKAQRERRSALVECVVATEEASAVNSSASELVCRRRFWTHWLVVAASYENLAALTAHADAIDGAGVRYKIGDLHFRIEPGRSLRYSGAATVPCRASSNLRGRGLLISVPVPNLEISHGLLFF